MTLRLKLILIGEGYLMHFYYYMYIEVSGILYRVKMIKKQWTTIQGYSVHYSFLISIQIAMVKRY